MQTLAQYIALVHLITQDFEIILPCLNNVYAVPISQKILHYWTTSVCCANLVHMDTNVSLFLFKVFCQVGVHAPPP